MHDFDVFALRKGHAELSSQHRIKFHRDQAFSAFRKGFGECSAPRSDLDHDPFGDVAQSVDNAPRGAGIYQKVLS